jgi:hypothetical protein
MVADIVRVPAAHLDGSREVCELGQVCILQVGWSGPLRGHQQPQGVQLGCHPGLRLRVLRDQEPAARTIIPNLYISGKLKAARGI